MRNRDKYHEQYTTVATHIPAITQVIIHTEHDTSNTDRLDEAGKIGTGKPVETIRVLIVDDHALLREGLRQLLTLEDGLQVVGEAVDGIEVIQKIRQLQPDVVLMDIHMPIVDGIAITRQVAQMFPDVAVIMLTMQMQQQQIVEAMKNGARGYILKSASAREVAQAIRVVHAGEIHIEAGWTGALIGELRRLADPNGQQSVETLAEKELEIIRYVATGMSNREIAETLSYSEKTVKNYLSVIYQKLHLRDRTQVAIFALRQGLLLESEKTE